VQTLPQDVAYLVCPPSPYDKSTSTRYDAQDVLVLVLPQDVAYLASDTRRVSFISVEVSPVHTSLSKALALFLMEWFS